MRFWKMAKLPKLSTVKDTVQRVKGYAWKLYNDGKLTAAEFTAIDKQLSKVIKAIHKK